MDMEITEMIIAPCLTIKLILKGAYTPPYSSYARMHDEHIPHTLKASFISCQPITWDPKLWHRQFIKLGTGQQPSGLMPHDLSSGHFVTKGIKKQLCRSVMPTGLL
jgi:hypothetical protein